MQRRVHIIQASVGHTEQADDDGCYDLHDVAGTPEKVGAAVTEALKNNDLLRGGNWSYLENGHPIFINITLKIDKELHQ